jgi:MoxR-like ATPase
LLLEGEPGVGKTDVAKRLAGALPARLIRLQCYEGLDATRALYEWNFAKQILRVQSLKGFARRGGRTHELFTPEFLIRRPLLEAIDNDDTVPPVLLIDEIDRADEEFEALLLEVLSDFQITVPELGTVLARQKPIVMMTSNRTRELHDALKRRCLYHWIGHPDVERELAIVRTRVPGISKDLSAAVAEFVAGVRRMNLVKTPGVAETVDWARALVKTGAKRLDRISVGQTAGALLKNRQDVDEVMTSLATGRE